MVESGEARVALVTGASRGIGRAIALRLAGEGRVVVLVSRTESSLEEVQGEIEARGGRAVVRSADVGERGALAGVVDSVAQELGRLDILVNNAGLTRDGLLMRMTDAQWDEAIAVNLTGAFESMRAASRHMMRGRFGRIVNISSTSGLVGNAGQSNYAAAKSGLIGLTRSVAREMGSKGITVNVIAPGFIETSMTANLPETVRAKVRESVCTGRLGTPEDVAAAVAYASSDDAGFLTGQVITVDGGMTMA